MPAFSLRFFLFAFLFALGLTSVCLGNAAMAGPEAEVRARELAFATTMAERNLEAFAEFISSEAVFFNGDAPLRGRDAIVAAWSAFFEGEQAPFSWQPELVVVLESGDLAHSSGPVITSDGNTSGRFNSVWRREADGVWRVVFDKGS